MTILRWNTQDRWESYKSALNIDTKERPDYLRKMYVGDPFNNNEVSPIRWSITNNNTTYSETNSLYINSAAATSSLTLTGNYEAPDIFESYLDFDNLHSSAALTLTISSDKDASIIVSSSDIRVVVDGSLVATVVTTLSSGKIHICKYSTNEFGFYYSDSTGLHYLYHTTITLSDPIYFKIVANGYADSIRIVELDMLYVNGYNEDGGHLIGYAKYKFTTSGTITGLYYDSTFDPEEQHMIQVSPNDGDWYGPNGLDTYFTQTDLSISVPSSPDGEYCYRVYMIPACFAPSVTASAYSKYIELRDVVFHSAYSSYLENNNVLPLNTAYSKFLINGEPLILHSANAAYQEVMVADSIIHTDTMYTFEGFHLSDAQYFRIPTPATYGMDGLAAFSKHSGTLLVETSSGTVLLPSESLTIIDTSGSTYVKIISIGSTDVTHIGILGIWL